MPIRLGALHDALLHPGDETLAQRAAEEVAAYEQRFADIRTEVAAVRERVDHVVRLVQFIVIPILGALTMGNLWLSYNIAPRLP